MQRQKGLSKSESGLGTSYETFQGEGKEKEKKMKGKRPKEKEKEIEGDDERKGERD